LIGLLRKLQSGLRISKDKYNEHSKMKRVISHQTADGKLFTDKCEALTHEAFLAIRGAMNSGKLGRDATVGDAAIATISQYIVANAGEFYALLQKYKEQMRRANCKTAVDSDE
jgi:hypothetical protein